jgi:hypothetical protein
MRTRETEHRQVASSFAVRSFFPCYLPSQYGRQIGQKQVTKLRQLRHLSPADMCSAHLPWHWVIQWNKPLDIYRFCLGRAILDNFVGTR